jgi:hypothetical protein
MLICKTTITPAQQGSSRINLIGNSMSMEAPEHLPLLGSTGEIVAAATSKCKRRRFSGRHPWLAFIVGPTLVLPLLWAASLVLFIFVAGAIGFRSDNPTVTTQSSDLANEMLPFVVVALLIVPIVASTVVFCRLVAKTAVSRRWGLACCLLLAFIGGAATASISMPTLGSKGSVAFGFGVSLPPSRQQLAQFILPLLVGSWTLHFGRRPRGTCAKS